MSSRSFDAVRIMDQGYTYVEEHHVRTRLLDEFLRAHRRREIEVSLDSIALVDRDDLGELITTLSAEKMSTLCAALAIAVDCDG